MTVSIPIAISTIALVVSLASFGVSLYNSLRDRPRLSIESKFYEGSEYNPESRIAVTLINRGRRPVILRMTGGNDDAGNWTADMLESDKGGLRLGEHERHEFRIKKDDTIHVMPDDDVITFKEMWVEDSLGTRHKIPKSSEYIRRLWS